jgi:hypothetical protein
MSMIEVILKRYVLGQEIVGHHVHGRRVQLPVVDRRCVTVSMIAICLPLPITAPHCQANRDSKGIL